MFENQLRRVALLSLALFSLLSECLRNNTAGRIESDRIAIAICRLCFRYRHCRN